MILFPTNNTVTSPTSDRSPLTTPVGGDPSDAGDHYTLDSGGESSIMGAPGEPGFSRGDTEQDGEDLSHGVHAVTKKTNFWFEREVGQIEKLAVSWAKAWAEKGLPRHDVPRTEPLEPEQVLTTRCAQLFREWQLRVRTKMQDAIEHGSQRLGEHVATLRTMVARLDTLGQELGEREGKIEKIRREIEAGDTRPVRYTAFITGPVFWLGAIMLVLVEFFTNFPIFRLLLPLDAVLEQAAGNAATNIDDTSWLAGLQLFARNLVWNVEAALVAVVAVIVLVVLGKQLGKSLRPLVVLRESDHPLASQTVRSHRWQHGASLAISVFGLVCVLAFLGVTRGRISQTAESRIAQDNIALQASQKAVTKAESDNDRDAISSSIKSRSANEDALRRHQDAAAYAHTIALNNLSIFFLNLGLIATAAMLGFGNAYADLGEGKGEHPDLMKLRDRCAELRRDLVTTEANARTAVAQARGAVGYVQHLLRSNPLQGLESKMNRLEGVIPMFRGENARERGLDPANIRAFDQPQTLDLAPLEESVSFVEPVEFALLKEELEQLTVRLGQISDRSDEMQPDLHVA
jgi:hypothetical protein